MTKHTHSKPQKPEPQESSVPAPEEPPSVPEPETPVTPFPEEPDVSEPSPEEALQSRLLRLQADFENYRKRMAREKKDWIAFASEKLVMDLLPVLDHFELGLADSAHNGAPEAFTEGFRLIYSQLQAAIEKAGVQPIDAEGAEFDPNLHEAITHAPSPDVPENHVMAQTRRGYRMGDRLLRPAQVVVSSGPAAE